MRTVFFILLLSGYFCLSAQPAQFISRGPGGGGALFFPKINPADDQEFYIASDLSAFFHSTNFGLSYQVVPFQQLPAGNLSTYEFTSDPNRAYSIYNDGNDGYPVRTTDGGQTWTALPAHAGVSEQPYKLIANFAKPNQLIANYYGDIFISNDGGNSYQLVKHTINNGAGLVLGGAFFDGDHIYLGSNEGLLVSTDGGLSFSVMPTTGIAAGQVIWSFAGARTGGTLRFLCVASNASDTYNLVWPWEYWGFAQGVYVMDNASGAWTPAQNGIDLANDFVMYAAMAWNDVNTLYLGGNDQALGAPLVMKSANGGQSWTKVFQSENNANIATGWSGYQGDKNWSWGETTFGLAVAPYNSSKVLFGDFGFVHATSDGGASWRQAYVDPADQHPSGAPTPKHQTYRSIGLENTTCWQVHWQTPSVVLAAYSDIGLLRSTDGGLSWGYTYTGMSVNSVYRLLKLPNGTLLAATSNIHDIYQSTRLRDAQLDASDPNGKIWYSQDDGATWNTLHTFNHPVYWLAADPNNPNRLYASVIHYGGGGAASQGGIWTTDDLQNLAASTWTKLPAPPRTEGHPASIRVLDDGKVVATYSGRINANGQFTASSGVFLYYPTTNSWADRSAPEQFYWTKDLVPDPGDPQNRWFVCVWSGWGGAPNGKGGLYRTTDRGQTWTKLTGAQFDRVSSITVWPTFVGYAYLSTETQGLWHTMSSQLPFPVWTPVESYPFRQPERIFLKPANPNDVWVTSFGNGLREGTTTVSANAPVSGKGLAITPNPAAERFTVAWPEAKPADGPLEVLDAAGRVVWADARPTGNIVSIACAAWPPGQYTVRWAGWAAIIQIVR